MTSHRRNLFFTLGLGIYFFPSMIKRTFFLPHGISIIIATVIGNTMAQQCVATRKIKISFNFYNSVLQCDLINQSRLLETSKKKHSISRNWQNFMHTKVKSIGGRWAITWALTLISSHFNQKYFLNVHSFPFAASYCIY